jgi:hypothetical protein
VSAEVWLILAGWLIAVLFFYIGDRHGRSRR